MATGLHSLLQHSTHIPAGAPVLVPCCGPGHELPALSLALGGAGAGTGEGGTGPCEVIGVDLSQGMIALAQQVVALHHASGSSSSGGSSGEAGASAVAAASHQALAAARGAIAAAGRTPAPALGPMQAYVGDACADMEEKYRGKAGALFSVFGLQQLGGLAPAALAGWVRCLAPGGVLVLVLWPGNVEQSGPWAAFDQAVALHHAALGKPPAPTSDWEARLLTEALQVEGAELVGDTLVQHAMSWPSVDAFWQTMVEGGPWRARRITFGDDYMHALGAVFLDVLAAQAAAHLSSSSGTSSAAVTPPSSTGAGASSAAPALAFPAAPAPTAAPATPQGLVAGAGKVVGGHPMSHHPWARMITIRRRRVPLGGPRM